MLVLERGADLGAHIEVYRTFSSQFLPFFCSLKDLIKPFKWNNLKWTLIIERCVKERVNPPSFSLSAALGSKKSV